MRGRGGKLRSGPNTGYNTGSGHISILSKKFNVSGTVIASTLTASTINCIDTVLNTSNNLYVQNSELYLNGNPITSSGLNINPYKLEVIPTPNKTYVSYTQDSIFTVPPGISTIDTQIWGAGGGYYGNGAYIHIQSRVTPGDVLNVIVGKGGANAIDKNGGVNTNGIGGGGDSAETYLGGAAGGGYSAIIASDSLSTLIVLAGGGGAASYATTTGLYCHGNVVGLPGDGESGGEGGTQIQAGLGGITGNNTNGASGNNGGSYTSTIIGLGKGGDSSSGNGGGGGGMGYFSGGGGAGNFSVPPYFANGGGGGSSYISSTILNINELGGDLASVYDSLNYYQTGVAIGGLYLGSDGTIQPTTAGGSGLVVISYVPSMDLYLTSPYPAGRFITNNIQTISTVTNNIVFNIPKPIRIYANNSDKYVYTAVGSNQTFVVPRGVTQLNVKLWGAAGYGLGRGYGAYVSGSIPVTSGDELTIIVGSQGGDFINGIGVGGFGGGGNGALGGGGRSAITDGIEDLVTAGGGGGTSLGNIYSYGGAGGVYSGQAGINYGGYTSVGGGGTQIAGGIGGISPLGGIYTSNYQGMSSFNYRGGDGAYCSSIAEFISTSGGGGGGGYYGGGGGGGYYTNNYGTPPGEGGAGGGGSSFLENLINSVGIPGNYYTQYTTDSDYQSEAGLTDGLVIISYPTNLQLEYTDPSAKIAISQAQLPRNGWIAGGQGIAGEGDGNFGLQYSIDGSNWDPIKSGGFPVETTGIAYNQSNWIAVGTLSTPTIDSENSIQISSDGLHWNQIESGGFSNGYGVVWGNGIWVAVGEYEYDEGGTIQTSLDGINWNKTFNSFPIIGYGVTYNTITDIYVAVGHNNYDTSHTILYSKDAINWNNSVSGGFNDSQITTIYNTYYAGSNGLGIATNNLGESQQMWVAVGSHETNDGTIQWSSDASNWNNIIIGGFVGFGRGIAYGNGLWVAVGDSTYEPTDPLQTIQWSSDGCNWNSTITGGFAYSGHSISFNGYMWIATGMDTDINGCIQNSTDGSNWLPSGYVQGYVSPKCSFPGILNIALNNYTFLTNSEVITNTMTTNYANANYNYANYISSGTIDVDITNINIANIKNLTANYGNIGDIYEYSYIKNMIHIADNYNVAFAIGSSKDSSESIEVTNDSLNWYGLVTGGFSPTITYLKTRITNTSLPKAILYDNDSKIIVAYGITNESIYSNDFTGTIQYGSASNPSFWSNHEGINTLNSFILKNLNNAVYTHGVYLLLTSIAESPILLSESLGEFYIGAIQNNIMYKDAIGLTSSLSAAYGFYKDGTDTYVVGTANSSYTANGNSPIFVTSDGTNFYIPANIQANMPPTFYAITKDTNNTIFFMVGPGISNGITSMNTLMYSIDTINWSDAGLEGVISARGIAWGSNATTGSNTVVIACEATTSLNTIITYSYTDLASFVPYVPNTLTDNVISLLYSGNSGSNFISSATYGFDGIGYSIAYDTLTTSWIAGGVGATSGSLLTSVDGSNWGTDLGVSDCPIDLEVHGILAVSLYVISDLLFVVGKSTTPGLTMSIGTYANSIYNFIIPNNSFDNIGYGIAYNSMNEMLVAVGQGQTSGTILYTTTGILSNTTTGSFNITGYGVTYGNSLWVTVGKSSTTSNILYSYNSSNWSNASYGSFDIEGRGVVYRDIPQSTLWVAVGKGVVTSNILHSSDGSNWFNAETPTFSNIGYGVTWDGIKNFVAVGDSGTLISPDGSNWTSIQGGDFKSQSNISGTGTIIVLESVGRGVASDGNGKIVIVGAASNTNRQYNWSNISSSGTSFTGFSSVLSEDGIRLETTHIATSVIYKPSNGKFSVGGLTNNNYTCIVSDSTDGIVDLNIWNQSETLGFNATNELQFINSSNRTIVANDITTNILYASNGYVSDSLFVKNNTNTFTLNATNVITSNANISSITSQFISTNKLDVGRLNANYISADYVSSARIITSSIVVDTISFTNHLGSYASIDALTTINTTASFFHGNGAGVWNVTAEALANNTGTYNIPNTNIIANNITATTFTGNFIGNIITPGDLTDNIIGTNLLKASTITTYGNINMIGTNGIQGKITGNGNGLTNVIASTLMINANQTIGTGTFTAQKFNGKFIGDGSLLTNLPTVANATNAAVAINAFNSGYAAWANYAIGANSGGFASIGVITTKTSFKVFKTDTVNGNITTTPTTIDENIVTTGFIQGNDITASGRFIGNGNGLTGNAQGLKVGIASGADSSGFLSVGNITTKGYFIKKNPIDNTDTTVIGDYIYIKGDIQISSGSSGKFIGNGSGLTGNAPSLTVGNATNAINAQGADINGFVSEGAIQGTTITATEGFVGNGSRLTGINDGNRFYRDTGYILTLTGIPSFAGTKIYVNLYVNAPVTMFRLKLTVFIYDTDNNHRTVMYEYDILGGSGLGNNQINPLTLINTTTARIPSNDAPIVTITNSFPTAVNNNRLELIIIRGTTNNVKVRFLTESIGFDIGSKITFSLANYI